MSREYVEKRLREIGPRPKAARSRGRKEILWSLSHGCWVLCDLKRGTGERLYEMPAVPTNENAAHYGGASKAER